MNKANPKFVLAIDHMAEYKEDYTYYALQAKGKAKAFAEAAIKAMKADKVYAWLVYARKNNGNTNGAEYAPIAAFLPSGAMDEVGDPGWKLQKGHKLIYVR